jgi:hypothetical protein
MAFDATGFGKRRSRAARAVGACLLAVALAVSLAAAQTPQPAPPAEQPGLFDRIGHWFEQTFSGAGSQVENFGREAGVAAKSTVTTAKDAAGAVVRIPAARVIAGHAKCVSAPNGAPDCTAAVDALCKANGLESGKSLDMTTAEVCSPKVMLSGRTGAPGECKDETFVSRALCQ